MKIIVEKAFDDSGNCRVYYNIREIHNAEGKVSQPKNLIICIQEETKDCFEWYTVVNDGCWYEPEGPVKKAFQIVNTEGKVLRLAS